MKGVSVIEDAPASASYEKDPYMRWLITVAIMLVTTLEIIDTTIVNVALPHIMGALSTTREEISWVLTSYIVAAGIFMPLTGFLVKRLGQKKLVLLNIVGFGITSTLCGLSQNLAEIVLFRTLQGVFGASLLPLSQLILNHTFPPDQRAKAMSVWGLGVMAAPVLGPTLGGYITEYMNWRWAFYINIPVCITAYFMCLNLVRETPKEYIKIDWTGMLLMAMGIGALQIFLDRGNIDDWFSSTTIRWLALISVISLTIFLVRGWRINNNIVNLKVFKNEIFAFSSIMLAVYLAGFFGILSLQPIMLETLFNYPADTTGLVMAPRGISSALSMLFVARFIKIISLKTFVGIGVLFAIISSIMMCSFDLYVSIDYFVIVTVIQGFGTGLTFVPLSTICYSTLKPEEIPDATGLFSFCRSLGMAIGISLANTYLTRSQQFHWNRLVQFARESNTHLMQWLNSQNLDLTNVQALAITQNEIQRQSAMLAFNNVYFMTAVFYCVLGVLLLFIDKNKIKTTDTTLEMH